MGRKNRGVSIGRLGKRPRRYHPKFKTPRTRSVGTRTIRMPGGSGFLSLSGSAVYKSQSQQLVITITAKKREANKGPGLYFKRIVDWNRTKNENGSVVQLLDEVLAETVESVKGKLLPERGLFLDKCSRGGDEMAFIERVCSTCTCWYCDLT